MDDTYSGSGSQTTAEDYRQYDQIWQRVSPDLNPYPEVRQESGGTGEDTSVGGGEEDLGNLPGAQMDPCCMGSAAMDSLQVLAGFIEDERAGRQSLLQFAGRLQNPRAVRTLRQMAAQKAAHIRQLMAAYYLTAGVCYTHTIQMPAHTGGDTYCNALRSAYHDAACLGFNYLRSADGTADLCLQHMFQKMGQETFRHADQLMQLLSLCMQ